MPPHSPKNTKDELWAPMYTEVSKFPTGKREPFVSQSSQKFMQGVGAASSKSGLGTMVPTECCSPSLRPNPRIRPELEALQGARRRQRKVATRGRCGTSLGPFLQGVGLAWDQPQTRGGAPGRGCKVGWWARHGLPLLHSYPPCS